MTKQNSTSHSYNDLELALPKTATKQVIPAKKRGRKGDKIANAFKEIPTTPVDFLDYCKAHGNLEPTVLRQIKRHDSCPETGRAFVRKNRNPKAEAFGTMQIWRDPTQKSPWLDKKPK